MSENNTGVPTLKRRKRRFGDRWDGYRLRNIDPIYQMVPVIMRTRLDSQIFYEEYIDLAPLEAFVRKMRAEGMKDLRTVHVLIAAMVRTISQKPRINRFIAGRNIYARNHIRISMVVKRDWDENGHSSQISPEFEPEDTLYDVMEKIEAEIRKIKEEKSDTNTDFVAKVFSRVPTWMKAFAVDTLRNLDKIGLMPKAIIKASPFHCSAFVTDMGSLGMPSLFHHLYEMGTTSVFLSVGRKEYIPKADSKGEISVAKMLHLCYVLDERICDGFYYSRALKQMNRILKHPEQLLEKPEKVVLDLE